MRKLFGTDGIRGVVNLELTPEIAFKLGNAVAQRFGQIHETLIVAKDTRTSGDLLESALAAGAAAGGMNVVLAGVATTPALVTLTQLEKSVGVMISASHNPPEYNGLKVVERGYKIADSLEEELENLMNEPILVAPNRIKKIRFDPELVDLYVAKVVDLYKGYDFDGIRIAVDAANGGAFEIVRKIYDSLGIGYELFFDQPDGENINVGCGSTQPQGLIERIRDREFDMGVLFDGDADRCLMLTRNTKLVDGDRIIAFNAVKMMREGRLKKRAVVVTIMSNLGMERYLNTQGITVHRTRVGDRYVLETMLAQDVPLGGEQSGHIIFLDRSTTGDGIITSLETLTSLLKMGKDLEDVFREIPQYPQKLINVRTKFKTEVANSPKLKRKIESLPEEVRVVVRPSGTEPLVRIMVEGKDQERVEELSKELKEFVENLIDSLEESAEQ